MPRLDGFGVLGLVRNSRDERIRNLPVIVISGDEDETTRKQLRVETPAPIVVKALQRAK